MTSLFVAWHANDPPVWGPVGRLDYEPGLAAAVGLYRFQYTRGARSLAGFEPFDGMNDLEQTYESGELFPLFKNRLLPAGRSDFRDYLTWSGFNPDDPPDPLVILGRTEGRKQTDAVELFPFPMPDSHGCYLHTFFAHGIRYMLPNAGPVLADLRTGDELELRPHPLNPVDPNAMAIFGGDTLLGYVPRYLASDVKRLVQECPTQEVRLTVASVNQDAPMQQRLLCRLRACWPPEFQPCQGPEFEPIVANASTR